jgi:hypothetical protein
MHVWIVWIAIVVSFVAAGCAERRTGALSPEESPSAPRVEAEWVTDREEVARAVSIVRRHPLVQSLERELGLSGLSPDPAGAAQLRGVVASRDRVAVTILSRGNGDDETRATYVALTESGGRAVASSWEMIAERDPRPDEPGFAAATWAEQLVWVKPGLEIVSAPAEPAHGAGARWNRQKFIACVNAEMPAVRDLGIALDPPGGSRIVRNVVESVGGAAVVIACAFKALW